MRYLLWSVVVLVVAKVFFGYLAAVVHAPKVSINKIKFPPLPSPAASPPLPSIFCCWRPFDAAPAPTGAVVNSRSFTMDRVSFGRIWSLELPSTSFPARLRSPPLPPLPQCISSLSSCSSSTQLGGSDPGTYLTTLPPSGTLVQAITDGFTGPLTTVTLRIHHLGVYVLDTPATLRRRLLRPRHHGLPCLVLLKSQYFYANWSSFEDLSITCLL
jgi:hypothetical protein